jgi:geranylgeranyl pyrophosphate synthase
VLYALRSAYRKQTIEALDKIPEDEGASFYEVLESSKAIEWSKKIAERYILKAMKITEELPDSVGRKIITEIIDEQLERTF